MGLKKFLVLGLVFSMVLTGLAGCGRKGNEDTKNNSGVKVGLIVDTAGLGDKSVNDQANMGLKKAAEDFGVDIKVMEPKDASQFIDIQQKLAESGYQLIINCAFSMADALTQVADKYKDTSFVIIDTVVDKENVLSATYATHEGSFLAGAIAAMKSESGKIGFVGGMNIPTIQKFQVGYEEGARYINPDIEIMIKYIGNDGSAWANPAAGKSLTLDMVSNGADVVYHAAGGSGIGVIQGAEEAGIWAIGVNMDQEEIAPDTVLTSMLTRGDNAVYESVKKYLDGEKISGNLVMNLENNGVGVVMSRHLTDEEKTAVEEIREKIINGEIVVTDAMAQ